jgi:hypothetical protein
MGAAGAVTLWIACAEDPTGAIRGGIARVTPSATYAEVVVGDSSTFSVRAVDGQGNPLPILPTVTVADANVATVTVDQGSSGNPLPQTNFRVRGVTFGSTTITMTAGGRTAQMTVQTLPQLIEITAPASLRSGETATISARAVDATGETVAGVPIALSVDDETVLAFDDVTLEIEAILAGVAVISATGPAGETGGVPVAEGVAAVTVLAGPPVAAALEATDFGAVAAAGTSTLEVVVTDAEGNQNNEPEEILSVMAMSSNVAVATVVAMINDTIIEDIDTGEPIDTLRRVFVEVTGVAAGSVDITGSVETTGGTFDLGSSPATVLAPVITAAAPSGGFGSTITINGIGLMAAGFETRVLVDGLAVGDITVISDTEIEARMPTFDMPGTSDLEVSVGGILSSNADTWEQTDSFDEAATEPNDLVLGGTPADVSLPLQVSGAFSAEPIDPDVFGAGNDYFQFTLAQDATIHVLFEWTGGPDNDAYVTDAAFTDFQCGFAGATGNVPEDFTCDLAAGDYFLILSNFDLEDATYDILVEIQ